MLEFFTQAQAAENCNGWNTADYFKTATLEDVTACLDADANLKATDENKWTPLHYAAAFNNPDVVQVLIERGADRKKRTDAGFRKKAVSPRQPPHF